MFTGIIEEVGVVRRLERRGDGGRLTVAANKVLQGTRLGDSIAVSGACLTVVALSAHDFTVDCMPETLQRTTLGDLVPGSSVNLERALAFGGRLGGHLVLGHVDAVAEVMALSKKAGAWEVTFSLPDSLKGYVAPKGSVAIDGISLTVITVEEGVFSVGVIPFTLRETTLRDVRVGMRVNLEADVLARYVKSLMETWTDRHARSEGKPAGGLTEQLLREQGFV